MTTIIGTAGRGVRATRTRSNFGQVLKKGLSTQELDAKKGDRERVVILGSGWAGFVLSRELDKKKFQTVVVSPRSYFVFTPLLASTAVGTLEFRTTLEPVRARGTKVEFVQGWGDDINFNQKTLQIEQASFRNFPKSATGGEAVDLYGSDHGTKQKGEVFDLKYDKLVVAVGCWSQTFGTPGVREHAMFLKDVLDAVKVRKRVLECFETASLPTTSPELRKQLLNFAIVGGGPTGVEFAAELYDLCHQDLKRLYPTLITDLKITIYDVAPKILPMFDKGLAEYALSLFNRDGIQVKTQHNIESLRPGLPGSSDISKDAGCFTLKTKQDGEIAIGMCVWSTGLMMNPFIQHALDDVHKYPTRSVKLLNAQGASPESEKWALKRHQRSGGLLVDDHFRVKLIPKAFCDPSTCPSDLPPDAKIPEAVMQDVFALGDVSVMEKNRLPATAQVANQEAKWLAKALNRGLVDGDKGFSFKNLGVMTYLGNMKAIMQTGDNTEVKGYVIEMFHGGSENWRKLTGDRKTAWLIWRGAYLSQTMSWRNRFLIPIYWLINWVFGRDISRF